MTWVPPVFVCGECGGDIARWPMKNLLKQDILDWRHINTPDGTAPHRAVLGTPVPLAELVEVIEEDVVPDLVPPPIVPARPALHADLPGPAVRLDQKAEKAGWTVRAWYMHGPLMDARWKFSRMVESVVLHLDRDGHRLVATWRTKRHRGVPFHPDFTEWEFDEAYSLTHWVDPLTSPQLNAAVAVVRSVCESCGEPPALHVSTKTGPVCHPDWVAALAPLDPLEEPCSSS